MGISTWQNIIYGMREAVHKGYKSKDSRQRNKCEVRDIWDNIGDFCCDIQNEIAEGRYKIGDYRHFPLRDRKKVRYISVLPFRDRCVQNDIKNAIEPLLLKKMTDDMTGGLPLRGVLSSNARFCVVRRMQSILADQSMKCYIQGDIKKFYDNVDNIVAMRIIEQCVKDRRTLSIIRQHLFKQKNLAIGDPFSHLIANLVMSRLVRFLKTKYKKNIRLLNYADDIFIASRSNDLLSKVRKDMRRFVRDELKLHYKNLYIRSINDMPIVFCGMKYTRDAVYVAKETKVRYIRNRHKKRSIGSYNGILSKCDAKNLRFLVEEKDNKHMADKIRRRFAGKPKKVEMLEGIRHTIVDKDEKQSRESHSKSYIHVQAIAEGLGLIVYSTSSKKMVEYLNSQNVPIRDVVIAHDWSGYYYDGTVYTDEEEEEMIRKQFNI